jgi:WD40 repeat protein
MPDSPYVGLKPYTDDDALRFFGREQERKIITANLIASRLTLLYGASGVGKSSVLRAGVLYNLRRLSQRNLTENGSPDFVVVYFNSWREDPMAYLNFRVQESIAPFAKEQSSVLLPSSMDLVEVLQACAQRVDANLLIILDQFEEYFLYHPEAGDAGTFDVEFSRAVNKPDLRVSFLISIREDALAKLDRFKGRIPNILSNYLRIHHLDRKAARTAIEGPLDWYNQQTAAAGTRFTIEAALRSAVLDQVQTGQVILGGGQGTLRGTASSTGSSGALIETPYLQIVMARLWEEERSTGSCTLRLETLNRLGGARQIVGTHLDKAMSALSAGEQSIAANIFHYLVTPSGTKIAQTLCDLAGYADLSQAQLLPLLEKLCSPESRILRPVESPADRPKDPRYQIFHDVLATPVLEWRARFVEAQALTEAKLRAHQEARRAELETEARSAARLRRLAAGLAVVFVLAVIASIVALMQWKRAKAQATLSFSRELSAAAAENLYRDPELSVLLAQQSAFVLRKAGRPIPSEVVDVLNRAVQTSRERLNINAGGSRVVDVAFTGDGERLETTDSDGAVSVWDAHSGAKLLNLPPHAGGKALSHDGKFLATVSDGKTRVWDAASGKRLFEIPGENGIQVLNASFNWDASRLAIANSNYTVDVWDLRSGKRVVLLASRLGPITFVTFDPNGSRLATGSADGATEVWDSSSGRQLMRLKSHNDKVLSVAFSPDGQQLVTSTEDRTVALWDLSTGKSLRNLNPLRSQVFRETFSPNGQLLATAGADGIARVWDPGSGKFLFPLAGHKNVVSHIVFSPDGLRAATASWDGSVRIWDVSEPHLQEVQAVAFSHDGTRLASVSRDGRARLWDAVTLRFLRTFPDQPGGSLTSASFSLDDTRLAIGGVDGTVKVWETSSGTELFALNGDSAVNEVVFSPDGTRLATASNDSMARVWDASSRAELHRLMGHTNQVLCVAFSPDGTRLATGSSDRTVKIWDIASEKAVLTTDLYDNQVTGVAFSPDGTRLATSSLDGSVILRDASNGREVRKLPGHSMAVTAIVFSKDGTRVATSSADRTVKVWDAASGRELFNFTHSNFGVGDVAFSPDGRHLATGADDGMVRLIPLDLEELLRLAGSRTTRDLRPEECQKHLHSECLVVPRGTASSETRP